MIPNDKSFTKIFAIIWSVFAIIYIGAITFISIPEANVRFADTILGFVLGSIVAPLIGYFYGSSAGSQKKTELLHGAEE